MNLQALLMTSDQVIFFLDSFGVLLLVSATMGFFWFVRKKRKIVFVIFLASLSASVVAIIVKELFGVPRPYITNGLDATSFYVTFGSFPSLHTTIAFALATSVSLYEKRLGIILFLLAAIVGFGRVAANVHYPQDVVMGAIIGSLMALFVARLPLPRS